MDYPKISMVIGSVEWLTEQLHCTDAKLIVGHTSSMIYEALALKCRVLRYASAVPAISLQEDSEFRTLDELETRAALPAPEDPSKHYFSAIGAEALKNYKEFFDGLLLPPVKRPHHG